MCKTIHAELGSHKLTILVFYERRNPIYSFIPSGNSPNHTVYNKAKVTWLRVEGPRRELTTVTSHCQHICDVRDSKHWSVKLSRVKCGDNKTMVVGGGEQSMYMYTVTPGGGGGGGGGLQNDRGVFGGVLNIRSVLGTGRVMLWAVI